MLRAGAALGATLVIAFLGIPLAFAPGDTPPPAPGTGSIPAAALTAYQQSARTCPGLRWEVIAGIGQVESGHGSAGGATLGPDGIAAPPIVGPPLDGSGSGANTTPMPAGQWAGRWGLPGPWLQALGPMQLLPPTFNRWAVDGDGNGRADPHDIDDAAATAAGYLCGGGARISDEREALRRYNPSNAYIDEVLEWADRYTTAPPLVVDGNSDATALLANPNITVYSGGRDDLASGRVDPRVVMVLQALAREHTLVVTSLVAGHPRCVANQRGQGADCAVSNHYHGRAADIAVVDGVAVSARHPVVPLLIEQLAALDAPLRPDEIGGPVDSGLPGVFTDTLHADHLHIGWDSNPRGSDESSYR